MTGIPEGRPGKAALCFTMDDREKELKRAKNTAYRYLTIRPRSRFEVEQKLKDRGFSPDIAADVISHLLKLRYLNDEDFARQWAMSRVRSRGFGRRRIEQELRNKGIASTVIRGSLGEIFAAEPEVDVAHREADKKLRSLSRLEPEVRRRRLAGFLERKGFAADIIRNLLKSVR